MPVAERVTVVAETSAGLLAQLQQLEKQYGMSTMEMVYRLKDDPDSLDYASIDANGWYCVYLAYVEVESDVEPRAGAPPGDYGVSEVKEGSTESFFYM